jgi:hypothetical protein
MKAGKNRKHSPLTKKNGRQKAEKVTTPATPPKSPIETSRKPLKSNEKSPDTRKRALQALGRMRREHLSLSKACRQEHIKPATFLRYVGSAVRQDKPGGRFRATPGDSFRRNLEIRTAQGLTVVPIYGSKNASRIANYVNAVTEYLRTGKRTKLDAFKGQTVKVDGKEIELITDPAKLSELAEADVLHFDQLYASATGRG